LSKPRKSRIREERIHNEAIVEAYGPEEQALGWYYYLENKIKFPFSARCIASKVVSPLRKGETVDVRRLAPENSCAHDMLVLIRWHNRNVTAPLSQLVAIDADDSTVEAIGDWHYWLAQGYCFRVGLVTCGPSEDTYDETAVEIATHLERCQSQARRV
jgi:hypothetical protein